MNNSTRPSTVAILGLGPMGVAIARCVAAAGHRVVVWNRTARPLTHYGLDTAGDVEMATSAPAAAGGADVVVICVRDHEASRDLVEQIASTAADAVVINVSTGTPVETVESAGRARALGLRYVTGAVMVPTPMVGGDQCLILYAGSADAVHMTEPLRLALGGTSDVVGEDHAVPPALDLAMLDVYFAGMYAFLHSAALASAHGIEPSRYLSYAEGIVDTLRGTLPGLTEAIQRRAYDSGEARLDMCLAFLEHIVTTSSDAGIDPGIAALVRDASAQAMSRWPGSTDWDVVAEDLLPIVD